jgi:hypothetical protein
MTTSFRQLHQRWPPVPCDVVTGWAALRQHAERMSKASPPVGAGERYAADLGGTRRVEYSVREEMALTLEDVLERRARCCAGIRQGAAPPAWRGSGRARLGCARIATRSPLPRLANSRR